jgi:ABC-type multidrug transport system fused ATPase/permease subunit
MVFVFPDTIAANIAPGSEEIDEERLVMAAEIANIKDLLNHFPWDIIQNRSKRPWSE